MHIHRVAIAAWRMIPSSFGITVDGVNYPHTNAVTSKFSGVDGLVGRGWFAKTGEPLMYRITPDGRMRLAETGASHA